jgi:hypothetical protein
VALAVCLFFAGSMKAGVGLEEPGVAPAVFLFMRVGVWNQSRKAKRLCFISAFDALYGPFLFGDI